MSTSRPARWRAPLTTVILRLDYPDAESFLHACLEHLDAGEMFIRTPHPFAMGERLTLQIHAEGLRAPLTLGVEVLRREQGAIREDTGISVRVPLDRKQDYEMLRTLMGLKGGRPRPPAQRVLLVEDNPHIVQMYSHALHKVFPTEEREVIVESATNGAEAMDRLHRLPPVDLVVTDVNMPVMDGLTLIERMRAEARTRETPVLVITAQGEEATSQAQALGAQAVLHKPVQLPDIAAKVRVLLGSPR
ncbi:MAG: response regulator [Deltaproteobacteria bacterium]|nr:response regulator [Deltaproteobacteria bacterium]